MSKYSKPRLLAYLALLSNSLIWSLAVPLVKKGFETGLLTPSIFLFTRFIIATVFSLPLILLIKKNRSDLRRILHSPKLITIICLETLSVFVSLGLLYLGVSLTSGIEASILSVVYPIFITIGGVIFLKEKEGRSEIVGLALAVMGTILLTVYPLLNGRLNGHLTGNSLILLSTLTLATYYLLVKKAYLGVNKWVTTHISFWVASIGFGAVLIYQGQSVPVLPLLNNFWALLPILYMAIPGSIIALTLYLIGQDKIEASEASLFTYLHPVFSIPATILLLGEHITLFEITALLIIFAGVFMAERR